MKNVYVAVFPYLFQVWLHGGTGLRRGLKIPPLHRVVGSSPTGATKLTGVNMSRPRYFITIHAGDKTIKRSMKARLGDHEALQNEMIAEGEMETWERLSKMLIENNGGQAQIERDWNREYSKLVGHDHHWVSPEIADEYWKIVENEG